MLRSVRLGLAIPLALSLSCSGNQVVGPVQPQAGHGQSVAPGIYQLTGVHLRRGQRSHHRLPELADPAPPYINPRGEVEIYGTAGYFIRYPSWAEYSVGGDFEVVPLDVRYPNGQAPPTPFDFPWDLRRYRVARPGDEPRGLLIGGAMSPTHGRRVPVWPADNPNRRLYFFRPAPDGSWVRDSTPIFGDATTGWVGHSYGGNLFQPGADDPGVLREGDDTYLFYEQVTANDLVPARTEIFVRRMEDVDRAGDEAVPIIGVGDPPFPSTLRHGGSFLVEGPRPIRMTIEGERFYVVAFSAGDYQSDGYTMSYAWSREVTGPYHVALAPDGRDLLDLGDELRLRFGLSWVGRPAFYRTPDGRYEVIFHAVLKSILPGNDYRSPPTRYRSGDFFRSLYKAELEVSLAADGSPRLRIPLRR